MSGFIEQLKKFKNKFKDKLEDQAIDYKLKTAGNYSLNAIPILIELMKSHLYGLGTPWNFVEASLVSS
jgi:hypothetical protein